MVGLEAITEVTEKRPQLQGTAQELARKRRRGKPREAARRCWIVPFFDSPAEDRSLLSSGIVGALLSAALYWCWTAVGWRSA